MNSRDFRFRAWDRHAKQWVPTDELCIGLDGEVSGFYMGKCLKEELVIMQFTGLKDKNGVEIYEGDIASDCLQRIGKILWMGDSYWLKNYNGTYSLASQIDHSSIEIIGNIYGNHELLTQESKIESRQ